MSEENRRTVPKNQRPGRGTGLNLASRFDRAKTVDFHDDWDIEEDAPPRRTVFETDATRSIIARNTSPDVHFDRSINPYRGCEHGCIYCFARPSHAFLGLSPGLDFETRILVKPNAPALLRRELSKPGYTPQVLAIGTNTDAYQPAETRFRIMRGVLEVLSAFRHPVSIVTKGASIRRDIDLLSEMGQAGIASVSISITTLDAALCRALEPRAAAPKMRLRLIEMLSAAGVPVSVSAAPVIPGLTDHELEAILSAAREAGAIAASCIPLRMPLEITSLFEDWLDEHRPARAEKIKRAVRAFHGGKAYDPKWGQRMRGTGKEAELLQARFALACRRLGLGGRETRYKLRTELFSVPGKPEQLILI